MLPHGLAVLEWTLTHSVPLVLLSIECKLQQMQLKVEACCL